MDKPNSERWRPIHQAHAIERVRAQLRFAEPLPEKVLNRSTAKIVGEPSRFGLDTVINQIGVPGEVQIELGPGGRASLQDNNTGNVAKRHQQGVVVEEAAYLRSVFGYLTLSYARWSEFRKRYEELFEDPIGGALGVTDVSSLGLEYWDAFYFDGDKSLGDAIDVLNPDLQVAVATRGRGHGRLWHSHAGWFESFENIEYLVNRNIDVVPRVHPAMGEKLFVLIYTMIQIPMAKNMVDPKVILRALDGCHALSSKVFGFTLRREILERIGFNCKEYLS